MIETPNTPSGLVGPDGELMEKPELTVAEKPVQLRQIPLITVAMEKYPAGYFAVVQIREQKPDGALGAVRVEVLKPTLSEALKRIKHLITDRLNKTQAKNGKSHLHVVKTTEV